MEKLPELVEAYKVDFEIFVQALSLSVTSEDIEVDGDYIIEAKNSNGENISFHVPNNSYAALIDRILRKRGFTPSYRYSESLDSILMSSAGQEESQVEKLLGRKSQNVGIVMFLNWEEPGEGTQPLHKVFPKPGDHLMLAYIVPKQ